MAIEDGEEEPGVRAQCCSHNLVDGAVHLETPKTELILTPSQLLSIDVQDWFWPLAFGQHVAWKRDCHSGSPGGHRVGKRISISPGISMPKASNDYQQL